MKKMLVLAVLALGALTGSARAEDVVRLGNQKFVIYGAVSYMKELAPKYGFRIEEKIYDKGIDMIPALMAGGLDVAASAADAAIAARSQGAEIYVVAGFAKGSARLLSRADLAIKRVEDLKGRKVAVARGSAVELLLAAQLAKHGLTWSDKGGRDVLVVYLPYADMNAALKAKTVDAILQSEPQATQALHDGIATEVNKPYDTELGQPVRVLMMSEAFYKEKPDLALRVLKCFVEATKAFKADSKLAEKYVATTLFQGKLTSQGFKDAMENAAFTYDIDAHHVQVTTDLMMKYGVGRLVDAPVASEWVKTEMLGRAKAALGVK